MITSIRIHSRYVRYIEPPANTSRYILLEASQAGLSRYLVAVPELSESLDQLEELSDKLPRSIRPAIGSKSLEKRMPQKVLILLSEGRHLIPERILDKTLPNHTPAFEYIANRLLSPIIDVDDVIRILSAIEDRKAVDEEGYKSVEKTVYRLIKTYLAGFLYSIGPRKLEYKLKVMSSHVRVRAIQDARAEEAISDVYRNSKALDRVIQKASAHIRKRNKELLNYKKGEKPAAFLVFTRDNLNVSYVYDVMNTLGEEGYEVREVIVAHESSSRDLAKRIAETLDFIGDVRAKTLLVPSTPGGILREFFAYLIARYERRGMKLFLDGRGGSPASFLAILRNFRDRLVLPDKRGLNNESFLNF